MASHALQGRRPTLCNVGVPAVLLLCFGLALFGLLPGLSFNIGSHEIPSLTPPPKTSEGGPTVPYKLTGNVAAIIENRPIDRLVPLLVHFSSVLGPEWPIFLFTSQSVVPTSAAFKRLIDEQRLIIRFLPATVDFTNRLDVSGFLTKSWLWEQRKCFPAVAPLCLYFCRGSNFALLFSSELRL